MLFLKKNNLAVTITIIIFCFFIQMIALDKKNGLRYGFFLTDSIETQQLLNQDLQNYNEGLIKEIKNLSYNKDFIEKHARMKLGMINSDEKFYKYV